MRLALAAPPVASIIFGAHVLRWFHAFAKIFTTHAPSGTALSRSLYLSMIRLILRCSYDGAPVDDESGRRCVRTSVILHPWKVSLTYRMVSKEDNVKNSGVGSNLTLGFPFETLTPR